MSAGNVLIKIKGDDSHFKQTIGNVGKAARTAVKGLGVAAGLLTAAWSAVGLTSVKYNAEVEQLQTSFKVMTGSADKAVAVMERLKKLGATTPFATKDLASATQLLMQYGMDADTAIDRMSMLGDIAQGSTDKMMRIAAAYGQMNATGKVSLEDVKQMIEAGFNPLLEISEKTGESMESLYDRISKGTMAFSEITGAMQSATSEGGKFFKSMEQQSQTVSGLLSSLQDELQTLGGDIFEPISEALRTKVLPEAIRLVQEMQDAYGKGGFDGLIDSLTAEIPKLLNAASAALEKVAAKLKTMLPGIIKKIVSALPSLLTTLGDSILPTIVDTIFEVIAVAVEEIAARLPELVPILVRGFVNLLKSVFKGIWNVASGLFEGLETALKKLGVLGMTPMDAFEQAWEQADTSQIKDIDVKVGVNITPEEYEAEIDTALSEVRTVLNNIPGLTEDQKNSIETAIINGTGIQLLEDTLNNLDLPEGKAEEIISTIEEASGKIDTALLNLGLNETQIAHIKNVQNEGGDVQAALVAYGVDPTAAAEAAGTIDTASGQIETAAINAGLDPTIVQALSSSATSDQAALVAALLLLGVNPEEIKTVTDSYDTISGSLTASAKSIFDQIVEEFTNGIPESDEDVKAAKDAVVGLFTNAYDRVELWRQEALKEVEAKGLTGDALAQAVASVNNEAQGMIEELNRLEKEALTWTEENANKSTAFVKSNLDQLDSIVAQLSDINARIDVLTNEQFNASRSRRELVKAGAVTNVEHQVEAFALTQAEMAQRIEEAEIAAGEAFEKAATEFEGDAEGYAKREQEILAQLATDKEAAYAMYNAETASIIAGIAKSSPEISDAFADFGAEQQAVDMVTTLKQAVDDAVNTAALGGGLIDAETLIGNLTAEGVDMSLIAEKLNIDGEQLNTLIGNALKDWDGDTALNEAITTYTSEVETDLATALQNVGIDVTALPPIKKAIEEGYLQAAGTVDWTSFETILATMLNGSIASSATGLADMSGTVTAAAETASADVPPTLDKGLEAKKSGMNTAKGYINGIAAMKEQAVLAASNLVYAALNAIKTAQQEGSPSKLTYKSGSFFGQGYALGIEDEIANAERAAQRMAESAIGAIDGIGGRISVSQQINAGGMASAFQTMLSSMNLATDNDTPVQLFINGRMVAESIRRDVRTTQAGYNTALAKGVGK